MCMRLIFRKEERTEENYNTGEEEGEIQKSRWKVWMLTDVLCLSARRCPSLPSLEGHEDGNGGCGAGRAMPVPAFGRSCVLGSLAA